MILVKKSAFEKTLFNEITEIKGKIANIKNGLIVKKYNHLTKSPMQGLMYDKSRSKVSKSIIKPIILEACLRSETAAAGSGALCLDLMLRSLPDIVRKQKHQNFILEEELKSFIDKVTLSVQKLGCRPTGNSVLQHVHDLDIPDICKNILYEAYSLSGKSGVIKVKKSNAQQTKLIVQSGSNFSLNINNKFLEKGGKWENKEVNCVAIDGIIIEVSEIHHLLEMAAESKEPFVIFAREFSPEVYQTILHNFLRKTLNVIPVRVPIDEESLNRLVDIAVVCGIDVISSQKGETISASVCRGIKKVEKISIDSKGVTVYNETSTSRKNHHIKRIIDDKNNKDFLKFSQEVINEKNALIDKRLGELFSETISLEIGQNLLYEHRTIIEKIDQALREIKSHTNIGYVNKEKLIKKLNSKNFLERHLSEVLVEQEKSLYSVEAIVLSTNFAKSAIKSICSIEAVLFYN